MRPTTLAVLASPLGAIIVCPKLNTFTGSPELGSISYLVVVVVAMCAMYGSMHVAESAAVDMFGIAVVFLSGILPPRAAPLITSAWTSFLQWTGIDVEPFSQGPGQWTTKEHLFCFAMVWASLVVIEALVVLAGSHLTGSDGKVRRKPHAQVQLFKWFNLAATFLCARQTMEIITASPATKMYLGMPQSILTSKILLPPQSGSYTVLNTVFAFVCCFVVYDLVFYTWGRCIRPSILSTGDKHLQGTFNAHPIDFLVFAYNHLFAIIVVSFSPLGCHPHTILLFLLVSRILALIRIHRLHIWVPMILHDSGNESASNFGQYTTLWDLACGTA